MLSRRSKIFILVLSIATVKGGFLLLKDKSLTSEVQVPQVSSNKRLFLGKRKKIKLQEVSKNSCETLKTYLEEMDFNEKPSRLDQSLFTNCLDPEFSEIQKQITENCFPKVKNECQSHLMFMRSSMRTQGIADSDDKETIADLILKEFSKGTPDFKKLEKLVKKLLRDDPKNPAYQRIWAMSKFIGSGDPRNQREGLRDEIFSNIDPEILNAPDMDGLRVFLETGLDPMKVEEFTRQNLSRDPHRQGSREALGWALWQQGRRAEALSELSIAVARNPHDQWLRDMYQDLQRPDAKKEDYKGRLSLGVKLEDILN